MNVIFILIFTQLLFTSSDFLARLNMPRYGFSLSAFLAPWFLIYFILRMVAMAGQLYVLTSVEIGRTMALFGAVSIVLSNLVGFFILKEVLPLNSYLAIMLAITAFLILSMGIK